MSPWGQEQGGGAELCRRNLSREWGWCHLGINNLSQEQGQGASPSPQADLNQKGFARIFLWRQKCPERSPGSALEVARSSSSCQRHRGRFPSSPRAPSAALLLLLLSDAGSCKSRQELWELQGSSSPAAEPGSGHHAGSRGSVDKLITCLRRADIPLN